MKKAVFLLFVAFFSTEFPVPREALAAEQLKFGFLSSPSARMNIENFLQNQHLSPLGQYEGAAIDLNRDSLAEYILRDAGCSMQKKPCMYMILAEKKDEILKLGEIQAYSLIPSGTYSHGIQDFLAFTNNNNDYEYVRYIWSPAQSAYILDEEN